MSRSKVILVASLAVALGFVVGLIVGRWMSLMGLVGLEALDIDQASRGTLAAEEGLASRVIIGLGIGLASAWAVRLIGLGGLVSVY